ncbi:MAG: hypothetical protein M3Y31_08615 [Gemmatimonadota bacterium]|nr:hypothetical protein [Gemmatimonadota bacterium]
MLDRRAGALYLGLLIAGCGGTPGAVVPDDAASVSAEQVAAWVAPTRPDAHQIYRYRWLYRDERSSIGGRGSARVAPPDSVRLDVSLALGVGSGSGVVVNDTMLWGRPQELLARFVPDYNLMWAMFGVARQPPAGATITGADQGSSRAWRYADGPDTVAYVLTSGETPRLEAEVKRGRQVLGRVETRYTAAGTPASTRLDVPTGPARLDITFEQIDSVAPFPADLWTPGGS